MKGLSDPLLSAIEQHVGKIHTGFELSGGHGVQVVQYHCPDMDGNTISTLGLSRLVGASEFGLNGPKTEWFMEFSADLNLSVAATVLDYYCTAVLNSSMDFPKRGSYVETDNNIWKGIDLVGLYFTLYTAKGDIFLEKLKIEYIVPIWVIPIVSTELSILESEGWESLENYWEEQSVDVFDVNRKGT